MQLMVPQSQAVFPSCSKDESNGTSAFRYMSSLFSVFFKLRQSYNFHMRTTIDTLKNHFQLKFFHYFVDFNFSSFIEYN